MLTVHMSGLMYFHGCHAREKVALVPNGTVPEVSEPTEPGYIPPHYASIWVESSQVESYQWDSASVFPYDLDVVDDAGNMEVVPVTEFRIPRPATVRFPDEWDEAARLHCFEHALPKLQRIDPAFQIDLDAPDTIARIPIRGGNLEVFNFRDVASVKWTIAHHLTPITIATQDAAGEGSVVLKGSDAEVVFSNNSSQLEDVDEGDTNHFFLYKHLEKRRDGSRLKVPERPTNLDRLVYRHAYMRRLDSKVEFPDGGCTPTCCG